MEEEKQKPNFWAVIPATVRYDKNIGSTAKLIYAEITALSNQYGYCWASNQYFADLFDKSVEQISRLIGELKSRGFIKSFIEKKKGNLRKLYPQVVVDEVQEDKETFEQRFDRLVGDVAPELREEKKAFIAYFTAVNDGGRKQHWQKQKTFSMRQRWSTWLRNTKKWTKPPRLPSDEEIKKQEEERIEAFLFLFFYLFIAW